MQHRAEEKAIAEKSESAGIFALHGMTGEE
jgi:hypothetical protein